MNNFELGNYFKKIINTLLGIIVALLLMLALCVYELATTSVVETQYEEISQTGDYNINSGKDTTISADGDIEWRQ